MRKFIYLFLLVVMAIPIVMISCADKETNMSQTGLVDQNGNVVSGTLIRTNIVWVTNKIDAWRTNEGVNNITTNADGSIKIEYWTNVLTPNLPDNPTDLYKIYVPFAGKGDGYYTMDYRDYNGLKQLWLDQIQRKGASDGKVFFIRNKANNGNYNNFQNKHTDGNYSAQDYYYFNDKGDIVWKEDNRVIKKFMGAIITEYRYIEKKQFGAENPSGIVKYTWNRKNTYTIGGVYANTLTTEEARWIYLGRRNGDRPFDNGDDRFKDGVFEFVAAREQKETYWAAAVDGIENKLFERQYIYPGFVEVLVMNPDDNWGYSDAAGVYSYYAYHGDWASARGFKPENMPYMTNHNIYIGERPEYTLPWLTHSTAFTDSDRGWCFLFMAGTNGNNNATVSRQRITRQF